MLLLNGNRGARHRSVNVEPDSLFPAKITDGRQYWKRFDAFPVVGDPGDQDVASFPEFHRGHVKGIGRFWRLRSF
ncbi:MAG TPA: hypothetical protein DDZ36_01665 [Deltaproteobacteria bacterium]|nr:hypothetical protein [Deltaproteobacteria bacterium]